MHSNCRKKILPILNQLSQWCSPTSNVYTCKYCNLSILGIIDVKDIEDINLRSNIKEHVLDSFANPFINKKITNGKSRRLEMWKTKVSRHCVFQKPCQLKGEHNEGSSCENNATNRRDFFREIENFLTESFGMKKPDVQNASHLADLCALHSDVKSILSFEDVNNPLDYQRKEKQDFLLIFLAVTMWRNEHFEKALGMFWRVYTEHDHLRKMVRRMLNLFIPHAISNKGEAILYLIINFSKKFVDEYSDYSFLSCVWEHCFLSNWHSDNEIAADLLEEFHGLRNVIPGKVHHITSLSLISNKIDVVYRLFEVLLKYKMKTEYELVMRSLFDYACSVRDIYACSAIILSCNELNVGLTEIQKARFLKLFCQKGNEVPIKTWSPKLQKFTFRF